MVILTKFNIIISFAFSIRGFIGHTCTFINKSNDHNNNDINLRVTKSNIFIQKPPWQHGIQSYHDPMVISTSIYISPFNTHMIQLSGIMIKIQHLLGK